jgi:hypothetical protein
LYSPKSDKITASAVARQDRLEFLSDIVPQTQTYKQVKENKKSRPATNGASVEAGQTTLDGKAPVNGSNGFGGEGSADDPLDDDSLTADPSAQLEMEIRERTNVEAATETNGHHNNNGNGVKEDVEMS